MLQHDKANAAVAPSASNVLSKSTHVQTALASSMQHQTSRSLFCHKASAMPLVASRRRCSGRGVLRKTCCNKPALGQCCSAPVWDCLNALGLSPSELLKFRIGQKPKPGIANPSKKRSDLQTSTDSRQSLRGSTRSCQDCAMASTQQSQLPQTVQVREMEDYINNSDLQQVKYNGQAHRVPVCGGV